MANSDNVLRGGLTPKHVDVDELLRAVDFAPHAPTVLTPHQLGCEHIYPDVADEFRLSAVHVRSTERFRNRNGRKGPEILLCMEGTAHCLWPGSSKGLAIRKGESVFIPAAVHDYELRGEAKLYKAGVGNAMQKDIDTSFVDD
jgi:mannose-6-phosphate isomerase